MQVSEDSRWSPSEVISTPEQLRALYREPSARAANKVTDRIDPASARFIGTSPFLLLATAAPDGRVDVSPRGGPPGFVSVLDARHLAIPDLGGNNRLDSFTNLLGHPGIGLLFVVPGKDETLRVNGTATLTTEPTLLDNFHPELRRPKLAVVVRVEELFGHCAKSFRRGKMWDPDSWKALEHAPDLAEIYTCQFDGDAATFRQDLEGVYQRALSED